MKINEHKFLIFITLLTFFLLTGLKVSSEELEEIHLFNADNNFSKKRFKLQSNKIQTNFKSYHDLNKNPAIPLKGIVKFNVDNDDSYIGKQNNLEKMNAEVDFSKSIINNVEFNTNIHINDLNGDFNQNRQISDFNVSTNLMPYHKLYIGQTSLRQGSSTDLELFDIVSSEYSLNNMTSINDLDLKIVSDAGPLSYSVGAYNLNADKSLQNTMVTGGYASLNPLFIKPSLGKLEMGGGFFTNRPGAEAEINQEDTYSLFTAYNYSRFSLKGEYVRQAYYSDSSLYSDSWHVSNKLGLTKNINLKTSMSLYEQTERLNNDLAIEYSLGNNKFLNIENVTIELNASFVNYGSDKSLNSQRYGFKTKYFF